MEQIKPLITSLRLSALWKSKDPLQRDRRIPPESVAGTSSKCRIRKACEDGFDGSGERKFFDQAARNVESIRRYHRGTLLKCVCADHETDSRASPLSDERSHTNYQQLCVCASKRSASETFARTYWPLAALLRAACLLVFLDTSENPCGTLHKAFHLT